MIAPNRFARISALMVIAGLLLFVAIMIVHRVQGQDTVLITLPSFGANLLAFLAGGAGTAYVGLALRTPSDGWSAKGASMMLGAFLFMGWLGTQALCWRVEAAAFDGKPIASERAEFVVTGRHRAWRGFERGKTWITVEASEGGFGIDVPVSRQLYDEAGSIDKTNLLDRTCLAVYIQRSGDLMRAVLSAPDGRALPPELRRCGEMPTAAS